MPLAEQQWCPTGVQVTVQQARGLRIKGKSGTNDAYAVMQVGKEKFQTSVVEKTVAPAWREEAAFDLPPLLHQDGGGGGGGGGGGKERGTLHVHVLHRALVGPDKLLGQAVVNLLQLVEDKTREKTEWFKLLDKTGKADKDRGEVLLDIQFMRHNMTGSMFDLSATGKSRSRLGKFKDKVRGKKKESDTVSDLVPSFSQVLTESDEEGTGDGEVAAGKGAKKKKHKMKSLFSHKSNLQKNMSQSMSVLPAKNFSLSGSQSSGLNVDSSEGKKKFKFLMHKRSNSSDSKDASSGHQKDGAAEPSNVCINGSHVYCEEPPPRASRIGSNFSLASSGHGSMEDVPESSPPSVDSLRVVRQYSPWTEEEEELENTKEDAGQLRREEAEKLRMEEEMRRKEEEEESVRRKEELERLADEKRRQEEEERRTEEENVKREEEERIRREEEERRQQEEEDKVKREQEECDRLAEQKLRLQEQERLIEEERVRKEEEERTHEERRQKEEEFVRRQEEEREEKKRFEEQERNLKEEEERIRKEEESAQEERKRQEEEERVRGQEEECKLAEEKRLEEEERRIEEDKLSKEGEERIRREEEMAEEERGRQEEEERVRRQEEHKLAEKKRLEEEERIEEERIRKEEEMAEEEMMRREEEKHEEKRRLEEQERQRREREERIKEEEEEKKARREKEEYERLVEENGKLEEEERKRIKAEEKIRREEEERIRVEEERRKEEERVRRQEEEREQLAEEKRILEEQERRIEKERKQREEEEMRRREEEENIRKEKEENERLVVEKMRRQEQERRRIEEEEKIKREEEERVRREEKAERERNEEEARKKEEEKLTRGAEQKKDNKTKRKAAGKKPAAAVESPAEVTSTNPFDGDVSNNPFEEIPDSPAGPGSSTAMVPTVQQRVQPAASSVGSKPVSSDEKDPINTQRERRPAPQPPGRNQAERPSQREQDGATQPLAPINKKSKDKDIKTVSVLPQRSVQMIAPRSRSSTEEEKNTQSLTQSCATKETSNVVKHGKRTAPPAPRSVEEEPSSEHETALSSDDNISHECGSEAKRVSIVYGLNPFEDDEVENAARDDSTTSGYTRSVKCPPVASQAADKDAASQAKTKSSKAHAPPLPAKIAATSSSSIHQNAERGHVADGAGVTVDSVAHHPCDPASEAGRPVRVQETPVQESQPAPVQSAGEDAGGMKVGLLMTSRRLQPVKPLNPLEQQSVSVVQGVKDNNSTGIPCEVQVKTKVNGTGLKGPYSQLTQGELISLVLKQEKQLSERDKKISELEKYIDDLLVRVIEEKPSILMSLNSLKKAT